MLAAAGCLGFNNPEGWAGPAASGDVLVASTDKGKISALAANPESGDQCDNSADDDEDGWVNEGCPRVGTAAETRDECRNDANDDVMDGIPDDDEVNDGCPAFPALWTFPTGDEDPEIDLEAIYTTPPIIGDTLYVGAYSGDVYALSVEDGAVRWTRELDGPMIAGLAASDTVIYAATDAGTVYALDANDGGEIGRP
jgi:outer membrane protein assembly factor BamB